MLIKENYNLIHHNTFRLNVKARIYAEYETQDELLNLLELYSNLPMLPLGEGSNVLFCGNFNGIVLRSMMKNGSFHTSSDKYIDVLAESGIILDNLIQSCLQHNAFGLECLSHIPGTVGASAVQNVGAYGCEVANLIHKVYAINKETKNIEIFENNQCEYSYRNSVFKTRYKGEFIITAVVYRLSTQPDKEIKYVELKKRLQGQIAPQKIREAVIQLRQDKLPNVNEIGSAGSFFKNPIVKSDKLQPLLQIYPDIPYYEVSSTADGPLFKLSAAWLIDQCGLKGTNVGDAVVFDKQPLVIVNIGNASYSDIIKLAKTVSETVKQVMGITLEPEVEYIGN